MNESFYSQLASKTCGSLWKPSNWKRYSNPILYRRIKKTQENAIELNRFYIWAWSFITFPSGKWKNILFKDLQTLPFDPTKWHRLSFCHPLHWITTRCWLSLQIKLAHSGSDTPRLCAHSAVISRMVSAQPTFLPSSTHSNKDAGHPQHNILIKSFRRWIHFKVEPHFLSSSEPLHGKCRLHWAALFLFLHNWLWNRMLLKTSPPCYTT